jgi:hypothetical protein
MDDWIVEFHDELRVPLLVGGGADVSDLLDRLIATLEERGVLSRYSLGTDPSLVDDAPAPVMAAGRHERALAGACAERRDRADRRSQPGCDPAVLRLRGTCRFDRTHQRLLPRARSPPRRHPRGRSTRQSRSLDSPGVGESAPVEFASSLVLTSTRRPAAHQPTRGALEQLAGQHGLGMRPENCAQLGPADRPRTRLPAYPRRARRASALRAPTDQPRSRSKDQVEEA